MQWTRLVSLRLAELKVLHNPVPAPNLLLASTTRIEALWGGPVPRILTAGSLKPKNNLAFLIRSIASLPKGLNARLLIFGERALRAENTQFAVQVSLRVASTDCSCGPSDILGDGRSERLVNIGDEKGVFDALAATSAIICVPK